VQALERSPAPMGPPLRPHGPAYPANRLSLLPCRRLDDDGGIRRLADGAQRAPHNTWGLLSFDGRSFGSVPTTSEGYFLVDRLVEAPPACRRLGFRVLDRAERHRKELFAVLFLHQAATQKRLPSTVASPRNSGCDGFSRFSFRNSTPLPASSILSAMFASFRGSCLDSHATSRAVCALPLANAGSQRYSLRQVRAPAAIARARRAVTRRRATQRASLDRSARAPIRKLDDVRQAATGEAAGARLDGAQAGLEPVGAQIGSRRA
jgi:hypothetical protein